MLEIPWLREDDLSFPPVEQALDVPNGLLALGGDLSSKRLTRAYRQGIFPWYESDQPIMWWSPHPRMVLFPERLRVSRSLRKIIRQDRFSVTMDQAFPDVIRECAQLRLYSQGTWITEEIIEAYCRLHRESVAHSVEVMHDGKLVGGLYGIALGQVFFGESMFSLENNASKVAMVHLVKQLRSWNYQLIDCQVASSHLASLGAEEVPREEFQRLLNKYANRSGRSGRWEITTDEPLSNADED